MTTTKQKRGGRYVAAPHREGQSTVTPAAPGAQCDSQLPVTSTAKIPDAQAFTCRFSAGQIAVVYVIGAESPEQARTEVSHAFVHCRYTVEAGDSTQGRADPFYLWICTTPAQRRGTAGLRECKEDQR